MSEDISRNQFAECLNQEFTVHFSEELKVPMKLIEVTKVRERRRQHSFSLLFLASEDVPLEQRNFEAENETLGKLELFLVPVGRDQHGVQFETVFNRLLPPTDED